MTFSAEKPHMIEFRDVHKYYADYHALRGINLAELLQLRAEAVMVLLPRITEPPLLKHEVENMEPVDLIACATEVVNFLAPQATLEKAQEAQREAAYLTE